MMTTRNKYVLPVFLVIPAIVAIFLALSFFVAVARATGGGLLRSELIILATLGLLFLIFTSLTIFSILCPQKITSIFEKVFCQANIQRYIFFISGITLLLCIYLVCTPDIYYGYYQTILHRLKPVLIWILVFNLQIFISVLLFQTENRKIAHYYWNNSFIPIIVAFSILVFTWLFITISGYGLSGSNSYWSKNGVPILWTQIISILFLGFFFEKFILRIKYFRNHLLFLELIIVLAVWVSSVLIWNSEKFIPGVFNTSSTPPSYEIFPINDSLIFDVAAQKLLLGQDMVADVQDKPIYISFLAILHAIAGGSYKNFYLLQIFAIALIPVLGYLIGKNLHSRVSGLVFSLALLIKERNSISLTNFIHVSTSKMILSEPLTTLGVLLVVLFLILWVKKKNNQDMYLYIAGGILGITSLIRLNAVSIIPAVIILIGLQVKIRIKTWFKYSIIFILFSLLSFSPWMMRNYIVSGNLFNFINNKTSGVIVNQRYEPIISTDKNDSSNADLSKIEQYKIVGSNIITNYVHNLIGITIMLPATFDLYNLRDMSHLPYWRSDWDGSLQPGGFWIILLVLLFAAIGFGSLWHYNRVASLIPLGVVLGYNLTTAVSFTSGGRYLVPIDWCFLFYFLIGMIEFGFLILYIMGWKKPAFQEKKNGANHFHTALLNPLIIGLIIVSAGSIPILLELLHLRFSPGAISTNDFIHAIYESQVLPMDEDISRIHILENNLSLTTIHGKALYPRFYSKKNGEDIPFELDPLIGQAGFDRLTFLVIGGSKDTVVVFPTNIDNIPIYASRDVWVAGCQKEGYIDAMVILFYQVNQPYIFWQKSLLENCQQ